MFKYKRLIKYVLFIIISFAVLFFVWFDLYYVFIPNARLKNSESAYLQEHKYDFVRWYPWEKDTLDYAKKKNKPLFINIGFSSCYWCHYVQEVIYKDPFVAKIINRYFVPVLVDRHQSPIIDKIYMDLMFYQTQTSGWPMIIMTTPDGIPLYFDKTNNRNRILFALNNIKKDWLRRSSETQTQAEAWSKQYAESVKKQTGQPVSSINDFFDSFKQNNLDQRFGGLKEKAKFPYFRQFIILNDLNLISLDFLEFTVSKIITSPMFDFVEGGVHRYVSNTDWTRPHFEKLLMDQIYFTQVLIILFKQTSNPIYLNYAEFNLNFILKNYIDESGLFITGLDSGQVGREGAYYFFSDKALNAMLPLNFNRIPTVEGLNSVSLIYVHDLMGVNRDLLLKIRTNSNASPKKDFFISIRENVELAKTLNQINQIVHNDNYLLMEKNLIEKLKQTVVTDLTVSDAFYLYDLMASFNFQPYKSELKNIIQTQLISTYPFIKNDIAINSSLLMPDYIDEYNYHQSIYFILKYYDDFEINNSKLEICQKVRQTLFTPWSQLSLVNSLKKFCL